MENFPNDKENLKAALMKRALGYDYEERVVEADKQGRTNKVKVYKKHIPPDTKAIEKIQYLIRTGRW